jgi:hypothetical protein
MPRRKLTHSRADVRAQIELLESLGKKVVQVKYHSDGTFRLITADNVSKDAKPGPASDWSDAPPIVS